MLDLCRMSTGASLEALEDLSGLVVESMGPEGPGFMVQEEGTDEQGETNQELVVLASEVEPADLERSEVTNPREVELEGDMLEGRKIKEEEKKLRVEIEELRKETKKGKLVKVVVS